MLKNADNTEVSGGYDQTPPRVLPTASDLVLLLKLITVNSDHAAAKIVCVNNASNLKSPIR